MRQLFVIHGLNPEPWTSPEGSIGRKNGKMYVQMHKAATLTAFQEALHEEIKSMHPVCMEGNLSLSLFLWRDLPAYESESGRQVRRHRADATNMQKAIEDALQGLVYKNDNQVVHAETWIMEQAANTEPCMIIEVKSAGVPPEVLLSDYRQHEIHVSRRLVPQYVAPGAPPVEDIF